MDIIKTILKCDSWSQPIDTMAKDGRWAIQVNFDSREDAKAFAVEMMMVTSGQPPYDHIDEAVAASNGERS